MILRKARDLSVKDVITFNRFTEIRTERIVSMLDISSTHKIIYMSNLDEAITIMLEDLVEVILYE